MKEQSGYFGPDSIDRLQSILEQEKAKKVFLVTGKNSYELSGAKRKVDGLSQEITTFNDFTSNPKKQDILKGYEEFKKQKYDIFAAIGGGSVIDTAKAIKLFHYNDTKENTPLVAIPTTSGSGSESTHFIVYYEKGKKQSKGLPEITLPEYYILDPLLTKSLPSKIAASTGMDALSQAMESYWSINSTPKSKTFAEKSIRTLLGNLEESIKNPLTSDRERVMIAANLAGKAINITRTTACHSISYPMTSLFGIPHGHAAALTLGEMLIFNSQVSEYTCADKRGMGYVKRSIEEINKMFEAEDSYFVREHILRLMNNIGLETKLSELGLAENDLKKIADNGFTPERVRNNPRILSKEDLELILKKIY